MVSYAGPELGKGKGALLANQAKADAALVEGKGSTIRSGIPKIYRDTSLSEAQKNPFWGCRSCKNKPRSARQILPTGRFQKGFSGYRNTGGGGTGKPGL